LIASEVGLALSGIPETLDAVSSGVLTVFLIDGLSQLYFFLVISGSNN
jgi:hypothetical protein